MYFIIMNIADTLNIHILCDMILSLRKYYYYVLKTEMIPLLE